MTSEIAKAAKFHTTRWSVVVAASRRDDDARSALEQLCTVYWEPVYAFLRRNGITREDAADLTQGFFARLVEKRDIAGANPERGRFRSFLLGAVKHFLLNEQTRARAARRGGGEPVLSLDLSSAESHFTIEPGHSRTPEAEFHRRWALTLMERTLAKLADRYIREHKQALFDDLKPLLQQESETDSLAEIAARHEMTEGAVKVALHRLRRRYRDEIRSAVADTVATPEEVDDEIRVLITSLES